MKKTCIIGWPIAHSRSPLIHNYWMKRYGIDSLYEKVAVPPDQLGHFIRNLPNSDYVGCNVTIPHKEAAFHLAAQRDTVANRLSAANTLYMRNGEVHCTSTDGEGLIASMRQAHVDLQLSGARVLMLGAGGSARSIIPALIDEGVFRIGIINRTVERITALQESFGPTLLHVSASEEDAAFRTCDILINTTSLGMQGQPPLQFDVARLNGNCLVADIIYTPLKTKLLKDAEARGLPTVGGLGMLLHQAVRGFELWYGVRPLVTPELWALIEDDVLTSDAAR